MRVRTVIDKEWEEIVKNRSVFWSLVLLPLIMTALVVGLLFAMHLEVARTGTLHTNGPLPAYLAIYKPADAVQIMMLNQFLMLFLMTPVALPIYIAAYSIIGEKQARSLEPLLATPVKTWELLLGKAVAAVVPPVAAAWLAYAIFVVCARFLVSAVVFGLIVSPLWVLSLAVFGPLFALLSVMVGVIASSRSNDPRAAQQWSALFILPLVGTGMGLMFGVITVNAWTFLAGSLALVLANAGALYAAVRLFQREAILTRWR